MPDTTPLLSVTGRTTPERLLASTPQEIKRGSLFLTFTKPPDTPPVLCHEITVALPVGSDQNDLVPTIGHASDIDDWPIDNTDAQWTITRHPAHTTGFAPADWGDEEQLQKIFLPHDKNDSDFHYIINSVAKDQSFTVDYATVQQINSIHIGTGIGGGVSFPPLILEYSKDGTQWTAVPVPGAPQPPGYIDDTEEIDLRFEPTLDARYLRMTAIHSTTSLKTRILYFWLNEPAGARTSEHVTFTCTPPDGEAVFGESRQFTLALSDIPINEETGQAEIAVTETTGTNTETHHPPLLVEKTDTAFFFENFSCDTPRIANDGTTTATLHWDGSWAATTYHLYRDSAAQEEIPTPDPPTHHRTHDIGPLTRTTTFVLDARTPGPAGSPTHHYRSTTVTVNDPDIIARTLTSEDTITVEETFTADKNDGTSTRGPVTCEGDVDIP